MRGQIGRDLRIKVVTVDEMWVAVGAWVWTDEVK